MKYKILKKNKNLLSKICIGTAQFGNVYGIANKTHKFSLSEGIKLKRILNKYSIKSFDTAADYGESEKILGKIGVKDFNIITKLPSKIPKKNVFDWVIKCINKSLKKLKINSLYGILIHDTKYLRGNKGLILYQSLVHLKKIGIVKKIGISIYNMEELNSILPRYKIDLVQAPYNVFDQRLELSGWMTKLKRFKIEIHARSPFLQGLLLMEQNERPKKFNKWNKIFNIWHKKMRQSKISPLAACLSFVFSNRKIDKIVLGIDNAKQFVDIINLRMTKKISTRKLSIKNKSFLINPSKWKLL